MKEYYKHLQEKVIDLKSMIEGDKAQAVKY